MQLPEWLELVEKTPEWLAPRIRVSQVALWRYLNGERRPDWKVIQRIVKVTGGAVTANDYLPDPVRTKPLRKRAKSRSSANGGGSARL
jgi:transcriptional regulator with XRE-family HTH domain